MTIELTLFTTDGCHLCDDAQTLLKGLLARQPDKYRVELVDIIESDMLVRKYGTRIPVLSRVDSNAELGWPFSYDELLAFITA